MSRQEIWDLAQTAEVRIRLHLIALRIDGHIDWHVAGIVRELNGLEFPTTYGVN